MASAQKPAVLGGLTPEAFFATVWQRRPLLIRDAFPDFQPPLDAEELAGLALEPEVESRLITGRPGGDWTLRQGPFDETDFLQAPERDWTLLVQDVDKHEPDCDWILDAFDWLPGWRIDDLMVSYAAPGGSVGPHVDAYDVFLLQGAGQRRWRIGTPGSGHAVERGGLRQHDDVDFTDEWVLSPGDMLYLPPGVPHEGVAVTACTTWSIGLRAVSLADLASELADVVDDAGHLQPLPDQDRQPVRHPHELADADLAGLRAALLTLLDDRALLDRAIARAVARPKPGFLDAGFLPDPNAPTQDPCHQPDNTELRRHPAVRMVLLPANGARNGEVYINGDCDSDDASVYTLAQALSVERSVRLGALRAALGTEAQRDWLRSVVARGHWTIAD